MNYLIVDAGNSRIKIVVFKGQQLLQREDCGQSDFLKIVSAIFSSHKISKVILSSVGSKTATLYEFLTRFQEVVLLSTSTPVPFQNRYQSPATLGVDRIALVSAAALQYPDKNVLVIDAGTCVTYDVKNAENEYLGGAISPGLKMRYKALASQTENLPLLEPVFDRDLIGSDSDASMHSGVVNGLVFEIEGFVAKTQDQFSDLTVVLTGGDAIYLSKRLKNGIFAQPNFLAEGLHAILIHNTHK